MTRLWVINIADYISLENVFEPLKLIDLAGFYGEYTYLVDFFIFLIFFLGLSRVAFEKHFKGPGGKFLITSVGVALAISMAYAEVFFGFSLKRLGSLAVLIFIFIFTVMVYSIFKGLGISCGLAGAVVFFYLALNALSPEFFSKITKSLPLLNLLFVLALILVFYKLFRGLFEGFGSGENKALLSGFVRENRLVRKGLDRLTDRARKDSKAVEANLSEVSEDLRQSHSRDDMMALSSEIRKLRKKAQHGDLAALLERIQKLDYRLKTLDVAAIKELEQKHDKVPEEEKKKIREAIEAERRKLKLEEQIKAFEEMCARHGKGFEECLREAESAVEGMEKAAAEKWLSDAAEHNRNIRALLREMEKVEQTLVELNEKELKSFG